MSYDAFRLSLKIFWIRFALSIQSLHSNGIYIDHLLHKLFNNLFHIGRHSIFHKLILQLSYFFDEKFGYFSIYFILNFLDVSSVALPLAVFLFLSQNLAGDSIKTSCIIFLIVASVALMIPAPEWILVLLVFLFFNVKLLNLLWELVIVLLQIFVFLNELFNLITQWIGFSPHF